MIGADAETYTIAGAFLLGAVLATIATLRLVRLVVDYFAGVDRRRRLARPPRDDDEDV
jgi:hypothetical protein